MTSVPVVPVEDDPKRPWKALTAAGVTFLFAFFSYMIGDANLGPGENQFTWENVGQGILIGLTAAFGTGAATYSKRNPKKPA